MPPTARQHTDASDTVSALRERNTHPSAFDNADVTYTSSQALALTGVPGAFAYFWKGTTANSQVPVELRVAGFSRGSIVALVTMTSFGTRNDPGEFLAFLTAEYRALASAPGFDTRGVLFNLIILVGLGLVAFGAIRRVSTQGPRATREPEPVDWPRHSTARGNTWIAQGRCPSVATSGMVRGPAGCVASSPVALLGWITMDGRGLRSELRSNALR